MAGPATRRIVRRALAWALGAGLLAPAAPALAAPPANDDYLGSWDMQGRHGRAARTYRAPALDTSEATVQADLFDPDAEGLPFGGGPAETTVCRGTPFGRTVWFDVHPEHPGIFALEASGFDLVIALYEYDERTARIRRMVECWDASRGPAETVQFTGVRRRDYTLQVGGAATGALPASGPLSFVFRYFPDADGDGAVQELDECPELPGTEAGCPPALDVTPSLRSRPTARGVQVVSLTVPRVPAGARVEARCGRCGVRPVTRDAPARGGDVTLGAFAGRALAAGTTLEVRVTRAKSPSGRFRFGAIGDYTGYRIRRGGLTRLDRCMLPGARTPRTRCRR